jgi:membrane-associated phospholipid phosphatase
MKFKEDSILNLFYRFWPTIIACFSPMYLIWEVLASILTYLCVVTGFDWNYFIFFRYTFFYRLSYSAATIGSLLPILLPLALFIIGRVRKNLNQTHIALALGQAAFFGSLISSVIKAFTGRAFPPQGVVGLDISHIFRFGFFRGGIFWGWPSSHTTIAFAMAFCLWQLFPKNNKVKIWSLAYALYIGIGVSISIHWFSDFAAGIIFGIIIGTEVGKNFYKRGLNLKD